MKTKCVSNNTKKFTLNALYDVIEVDGETMIAKDDLGRSRKCIPIHGGTMYRVSFCPRRGATFKVEKSQAQISEEKKPWYRRKENLTAAIFVGVILLVASVAFAA